EEERVTDPHDPGDDVHPPQEDVEELADALFDHAQPAARRPARIFRNERERSSSSVSPAASVSASEMAPQARPRRKKLRRACPVAASSNTSPTSVACADLPMKFERRAVAAASASR